MHSRRFIAAWIVLSIGALLATYLWSMTLLPPDETRYAGVALEMWQSGQFWVPYANGVPYSHKPPLLFWVIQAGWALGGVSLWWIRSAVACFSLAGLGVTYLLARCLDLPPRTAQYAPVILLGTLLWALFTPAVMFDIAISLFAVLSLLGVARVARTGRGGGWALVALGLGLGTLTKGPVILVYVLPPILLAPLWHPRPGGWKRWYIGAAAAAAAGAALALAWAVPAAVMGGEQYGNEILWGQSAGRIARSFAHARPTWWYIAVLPGVLFPWSGWIGGWRRLRRLPYREDWGLRFLLTALLPALVCLSLVSAKQPHYLAPLLPVCAILIARAVAQPGVPTRSAWWDAAPCALVWLLVAALALWVPGQQAARGWPGWFASIPPWVSLGFAALALLHLLPMRTPERRVIWQGSLVIVTLVGFVLGPGRLAVPAYDVSAAARLLRRVQDAGRPVAHVGRSHNRFRFLGRLRRPVDDVKNDSLPGWICRHPDGVVVLYDRDARESAPAIYEQPFRSARMRIVEARELVVWAECPVPAGSVP